MNRINGLLGTLLLLVLLIATRGNAGSRPDILFAWHAVVLAAVLLAWCVAHSSGTGRRPVAGVALGLCALGLVVTAGVAKAPYFFAAWLVAVEVAAFLAVLALAVRSRPFLLRWAGPVLVAAGWFQTGLLVFQRFGEQDPRPAGSFLNPNYLAGWLAATLLFCAGRYLGARECRIARWTAIASIPLLAGFVLTGSRGALVALAAGSIVLVAAVWGGLQPRGRRALVAVLVLVGLAGGTALALRLRQPDPYRYQRLKIWRASVTPLLSDPWSGTGPGQFSRASHGLQFPDGRGALRYDRGFRATHSDWIRAGAELGWPGVAALAWIVVSVLAHAARRRRDAEPVDPGALAALAGLFAQAAVDNVTRAPALYLFGAVCLGIVIAVEAPSRRSVRPAWRLLVAALVLYLFVVGEGIPLRAWVEQETPGSPGAIGNLADAEAWMDHVEHRHRSDSDYFISEGRPIAERAVSLSPRDGELLRRLARLEVESLAVDPLHRAKRDRIVSLFERSGTLQRSNPFVPMELAAFHLDTGSPAAARRAAERALEIEPESASPRLLLSRAHLDAGDVDRAEEWLASARAAARSHADEARVSPYARDLLTLDPGLVGRLREGIRAARQPDSEDPRFEEDQEEEAGV